MHSNRVMSYFDVPLTIQGSIPRHYEVWYPATRSVNVQRCVTMRSMRSRSLYIELLQVTTISL